MYGTINPLYGNYILESIVYNLIRVLNVDIQTIDSDYPEMWYLSDDAYIYCVLRADVREFNDWHDEMIESGSNPDRWIHIKHAA